MDSDLTYTARLREVVERCLLESQQQAPENTRRAYAPKQEEWKVQKEMKDYSVCRPLLLTGGLHVDLVSEQGLRVYS